LLSGAVLLGGLLSRGDAPQALVEGDQLGVVFDCGCERERVAEAQRAASRLREANT